MPTSVYTFMHTLTVSIAVPRIVRLGHGPQFKLVKTYMCEEFD